MRRMEKALIIALIACLSIVIPAVALQLGIFFSGEVVTNTVEGEVTVSLTNSTTATWTSGLSNVAAGDDWYARFEVTGNGYAGPVTITWVLQEKVDATWTDTAYTVTTTFTLSGTTQTIYASSDGTIDENYNWGTHTTMASTWRVALSIETV